MSTIFSIIPARGGSKRFPGKNVALLNDKPLINYSIEYSLKQVLINKTFVSTDDAIIAAVSEKAGANVLKRPAIIAQDDTPTAEVVRYHCVEWENIGKLPDWIILFQPTNPLRPQNLIFEALSKLQESKRDSLVTFSPLKRKYGIIENEQYIPENYYLGKRMQDIKERFFENGLLYIVKGSIALQGNLFGDNPYPLITNCIESEVDIDEPQDMIFAEAILKILKK
jgi:N-acylneuraminate cytidylyltransferase